MSRFSTALLATASAMCVFAIGARGGETTEDSSPIWIYCQSEASGSTPAQYFGYFIFDRKQKTFKEYDAMEETVTDVHATIEEDSISWVKTSDDVIGPQQMQVEQRYSIDRRSLAAVERRELRITALREGVQTGTTVETFYGQCKKIAKLPIKNRQL
jgi:hypothetical protein